MNFRWLSYLLLSMTLWLVVGYYPITAQVELRVPANAIAWSPDATKIATAQESELALWDAATGVIISSQTIISPTAGSPISISSIVWLPNSETLLIGGSPYTPIAFVLPFNTVSNTVITTMVNQSYIQDMKLNPNGSVLVVASPDELGLPGDDAVILWDMSDYAELQRINGESIEGIAGVAIRPDNTQVAIISSLRPEIQIREISSGTLITTLTGNMEYPNVIDWSADGQYIAVASADVLTSNYTITIWDTSAWTVHSTTQAQSGYSDIAWNPTYPIFAVQDDRQIIVYDLQGNVVNTIQGAESFAWSPDGTKLATGNLTDYNQIEIAPTYPEPETPATETPAP
jgi:WD40 repeat protein